MSRNIRYWARFSLVAFLLVGTFALLNARTKGELVPPHKSLLAFPTALAGWQGHLARVSSCFVTTQAR